MYIMVNYSYNNLISRNLKLPNTRKCVVIGHSQTKRSHNNDRDLAANVNRLPNV